MKGIEIQHCQAGSVTSRQDGSVKISFVTPELRPSEAGALILLHGKNVCVSIVPEECAPEEIVRVDTERAVKSPSTRFRSILFILWRNQHQAQPFEQWYAAHMESLIDAVKEQLP